MARTHTYTWYKVSDKLPPEEKLVKTKIEGEEGKREQDELYYKDNQWRFENGEKADYIPTHWTFIP